MVVAVVAVGMVQHSLIQVIQMIPVGNRWVPTALVPARAGDRCTPGGIVRVHFKHMFIVVPLV
jgi:hypothetical protein